MAFSLEVLKIDPALEARKVADFVVHEVKNVYHRNAPHPQVRWDPVRV